MAGINYRKAIAEDAKVLAALINSAYRGDEARAGWTYESDLVGGLRITEEEIRVIVARPSEFFLLVERDTALIGCAHVQILEDALSIGMLTVRPGLQNGGIGSRLLAELEDRARALGKTSTRLDVIHVRSELIAYYERKGYLATGHSVPFPPEYPAKIPGLLLLELRKTL